MSIDDLRALVGSTIGVGEWTTITQERIDAFADATDDHQWIHVDGEKAEAGPFGSTIAHGFLVLSLIPAIAPRVDLPARMAVNYGLDRVRFITPVPSGSRVRAHAVLEEVAEVAGGVQTIAEVTIELEGSERPACVAICLARFYV
ncbi:MAG: MaoC family dehydratase [Acidimicrobiia bacterium]